MRGCDGTHALYRLTSGHSGFFSPFSSYFCWLVKTQIVFYTIVDVLNVQVD